MLSNVIIEQIKDKGKRKDKNVQAMLYGTVAGNIIKKYRCISRSVKQQSWIGNELLRL